MADVFDKYEDRGPVEPSTPYFRSGTNRACRPSDEFPRSPQWPYLPSDNESRHYAGHEARMARLCDRANKRLPLFGKDDEE